MDIRTSSSTLRGAAASRQPSRAGGPFARGVQEGFPGKLAHLTELCVAATKPMRAKFGPHPSANE
jgi:hypothetical protein